MSGRYDRLKILMTHASDSAILNMATPVYLGQEQD